MELCVPLVNVIILLCKSYEETKKAPCRSGVLFEISIGSKLSLGVLTVLQLLDFIGNHSHVFFVGINFYGIECLI